MRMRMRMPARSTSTRRVWVAVLVGLSMAASSGPVAAAPSASHVGAPGLGDPYYPTYGNGGYDVQRYRLELRYDPATDQLEGVAKIDARATQDLDRFDLDLVGLSVHRIRIRAGEHRRDATWSRTGSELVVTPARRLHRGTDFTVAVRYGGVPRLVQTQFGDNGFFATDDGAIVAGEPEGAATWFPVNDHPIDKATYAFRITVPDGLGVVANGLPEGEERAEPGWTTHLWRARSPMASYLATIDVGRWDLRRSTGPHGLPIIDAVDPDLGTKADATLARQADMIAFLEGVFGRYPFEAAGAIVDDQQPVLFSLETQTRPVYSGLTFVLPNPEATVVHELAHQWVGDDVSVRRWSEIWLNEGFATYAEWLWQQHEGGGRLSDIATFVHAAVPAAAEPFWQVRVGDPGVADLFSDAVYVRGGLTLEALRRTIGDRSFFEVLRRWASQHEGGNVTTADFIALSEEVSGQQLDGLFRRWLFTPGKPALPPA
jgi:aminopeptidase N